jgi:GNAT superfamily N-acetyltransferase
VNFVLAEVRERADRVPLVAALTVGLRSLQAARCRMAASVNSLVCERRKRNKLMEIGIRRLREDQIEAGVELLARAFHDSPHAEFWEPDPERRVHLLREQFLRSVRYCFARGEPHVAESEQIAGVALWMPPHSTHRTSEEDRDFGFDQLPVIFGEAAFARYRLLGELLTELHERDMSEPHWYLPTLGVDPARHGTGIGGALLRQGCIRADETSLPCYLDTAKPRNVPFYERHGFKILAHGLEPFSKVPYWTFRRDPPG